MRREELNLHDQVLTRYQYKAEIISFTERYVILNNGDKEIRLHHSDIIQKIGGRGNEKGI